MSKRAKTTFMLSCVFTLGTISAVHLMKERDSQTRRVGIDRDDEKRAQRRENVRELERQDALRKELEQGQNVVETSPTT
ncbi:hypothetical protein DFS34DRAFT_647934 [Phlyctochytrium arcticum]|nr:hypothetical protein DFS34DRAFT_647934 [Phlyctochytrium arcticum]